MKAPEIIKATQKVENQIIEYEIPVMINQQTFNELCKVIQNLGLL